MMTKEQFERVVGLWKEFPDSHRVELSVVEYLEKECNIGKILLYFTKNVGKYPKWTSNTISHKLQDYTYTINLCHSGKDDRASAYSVFVNGDFLSKKPVEYCTYEEAVEAAENHYKIIVNKRPDDDYFEECSYRVSSSPRDEGYSIFIGFQNKLGQEKEYLIKYTKGVSLPYSVSLIGNSISQPFQSKKHALNFCLVNANEKP